MLEKKKIFTLRDAFYCVSSLIFFYLQLHLILRFVAGEGNLVDVCISLAAFKLGELLNEQFDFGPFIFWLFLAAMSGWLSYLSPGIVCFTGCLLFGFSMKKLRERFFPYVVRSKKVWFRTFAFILAPFTLSFVYIFVIGVFGLVGLVVFLKKDPLGRQAYIWKYKAIRVRANAPVYWTNFLHHLHYFAYCYSIPLILSTTKTLPFALYGVIFYLGWAVYNPYERLVKPGWNWYIVGHILSFFIIIALYFLQNPILVVICWFITGLGGGSIYMLSRLMPIKTSDTKQELQIAEAYGQFLGILCWGLTVTSSISLTFLVSASVLLILLVHVMLLAQRMTDQVPATEAQN